MKWKTELIDGSWHLVNGSVKVNAGTEKIVADMAIISLNAYEDKISAGQKIDVNDFPKTPRCADVQGTPS